MENVARAWDGTVDWSDRFWSKVHPEALSGCWLWHGNVKQSPWAYRLGAYGAFKVNDKNVSAHRYAYAATKGPIGDLHVCHTCDVRSCVNPDHLFLGTRSDNIRDAVAKGRHIPGTNPARGERSGSSKLTEATVADIWRRLRAGESGESLARAYGVAGQTVHSIKSGLSWGWFTKALPWETE